MSSTTTTTTTTTAAKDDDNSWSDDEWQQDQEPVKCLCCDQVLPSLAEAAKHCAEEHGLDVVALVAELELGDLYGRMRLVNFVRARVAEGVRPDLIVSELREKPQVLQGDELLKPVMQDDPFLFGLDELVDSGAGGAEEDGDDHAADMRALVDENELLRGQLSMMQQTMDEMRQAMRRLALESSNGGPSSSSSSSSSNKATSSDEKKTEEAKDDDRSKEIDLVYFDSYSYRDIHEEMLKDRVRTLAYRDAIYNNKDLFKDKVIMDVGCGTGVLSMFAARAGAKHVIGLDMAEIIDRARDLVAANGLSDKITLVKGKAEDMESLPHGFKKVDVIVSEWMGYFLLFESMLPTVLTLRDKWLADDGVVFPNRATMFIEAASAKTHRAEHIDFWRDCYGLDFSALIQPEAEHPGAVVQVVDASELLGGDDKHKIFDVDIGSVADADLDFESDFELSNFAKDGGSDVVERFVVWFDTDFTERCQAPVTLTTDPRCTPTHWKQTSLYLAKPLPVRAGDIVKGKIVAKRSASNHREYDVELSYALNDGERTIQTFRIQ